MRTIQRTRHGLHKKDRPWSAAIEYVDKDGYHRVGKGRIFIVEGKEVELYPLNVLVGVLCRTAQTIYAWEKKYGFPPALWRVSNDQRKKRWYSRKQIVSIAAIYNHFGRLKGRENKQHLTTFIAAVRQVFYTVDMPVVERTPSCESSNPAS